ncbi:hypothetical protein GCM10009733_017480 [Nonomuraea maheshkhaliensis]|uniref:Uncharacterized protein n=1 Tax=Nonomuraea maheshkhaliensis TaxID=419590 RepID=A0ABN2F0G0_9ACTN
MEGPPPCAAAPEGPPPSVAAPAPPVAPVLTAERPVGTVRDRAAVSTGRVREKTFKRV